LGFGALEIRRGKREKRKRKTKKENPTIPLNVAEVLLNLDLLTFLTGSSIFGRNFFISGKNRARF